MLFKIISGKIVKISVIYFGLNCLILFVIFDWFFCDWFMSCMIFVKIVFELFFVILIIIVFELFMVLLKIGFLLFFFLGIFFLLIDDLFIVVFFLIMMLFVGICVLLRICMWLLIFNCLIDIVWIELLFVIRWVFVGFKFNSFVILCWFLFWV